MKKFENLKVSEIKKAEKAANVYFNRKDCVVTGYFAQPSKIDGWYEVDCEICFGYGEDRAPYDVRVCVMLSDRRRSFADVKTW